MRSNGIMHLDQRTYGELFEDMFAALLDPKRVAAYKKKLARLEQAARKTAAAEAVIQVTAGAGMQVPDAASNSGGAIAA
jgi:pyridoxine 5'-phosphate synthase PdxJ